MRFSFLLSDYGGSPLQVGLERGLVALGHTVGYFRSGQPADFDVLVVFNQCAHTRDYAYPVFPQGDQPVVFVDSAEYGYFCYLPERSKAYANAFATSSMVHDLKNADQQHRLKAFLQGRSFPYFLVNFSKYLTYPENYHPISYPLYLHSECHDRPNREKYLARDLDLFVSWGNNHPWRLGITEALESFPCKKDVSHYGDHGVFGNGRIEQTEYFRKMEGCRVSVASDGYGPFSFRTTEVLCRTALLMGPEYVVSHAPLEHLTHCLRYSVARDGEEFVSTDVVDKLKLLLDNSDLAFRLYEAGYEHCLSKMTEVAVARYFLERLESHDWLVPTPLKLSRPSDGIPAA